MGKVNSKINDPTQQSSVHGQCVPQAVRFPTVKGQEDGPWKREEQLCLVRRVSVFWGCTLSRHDAKCFGHRWNMLSETSLGNSK